MRLAAGIAGRPLHLIGPDLFVEYRQLLVMLLSIVMPIVGIVQAAVALAGGDDYIGALIAGIGGAWTVGLHIFFWVTITFAVVERVDAVREARDEITGAAGRWTVDRLPALPGRPHERERRGRGGASATALVDRRPPLPQRRRLVHRCGRRPHPAPQPRPVELLVPALIAILAALGGLQIVVFLVGRWTMPLAAANAVLQVAFTVPVVVLALTGSLINPAFADALGWPPLAEGRGPVMLALAAGALLVTAWEIYDAFRRARRADARAAGIGEPGQAAR